MLWVWGKAKTTVTVQRGLPAASSPRSPALWHSGPSWDFGLAGSKHILFRQRGLMFRPGNMSIVAVVVEIAKHATPLSGLPSTKIF